MSKIKIKNFGPIKEGYQGNDGWFDVKKVTMFIGNQASGKSTLAKVISTLTWVEKALNRGDFDETMSRNDFEQYFIYQNLKGYFKDNTVIEYQGDMYSIQFQPGENPQKPFPIIKKNDTHKYTVPKIMYVPAERNFLSVIKGANSVRGLPEPLFEFAEELRKAQEYVGSNGIKLPINEVFYKYDSNNEAGVIYNSEYSINILAASSGFQSLVPLFLVSNNLSDLISKVENDLNADTVSVDQKLKANRQIIDIMNAKRLTNDEKVLQVENVKSKFISKSFLNIVEEPEQNLFPSSQHQMLHSLLKFNNVNDGNKLIMTTHSPYLINYLTLAVKAEMVNLNLKSDVSKKKLAEIVPLDSTVKADDLVIYEMNEKNGTIKKLENYKGLPSDDNDLNNELEESNELFAQLQEIEKGWR